MLLLLACDEPAPAPPTPAAEGPRPPQVSAESVAWLREQGWWPLRVGYFADVPGYAAHFPVMREDRLLQARGLEVEYSSFLSGPPILEAFLAGQTQVSAYGNFPFWSTVDKGVGAVAYALTGVNVEAAILVAPDSPFHSVADLAKAGRPVVIGTTLGSYAEFYLLAVGRAQGMAPGVGYRLAGMSMRDAQLVPKGVDAVALWDPHVSFALEKGLGRRIDSAWDSTFTTGYEFVRREVAERAPDVLQALSDASLEAWTRVRADPDRAAALYVADPKAQAWSEAAVRRQIDLYVGDPALRVIHPEFWSAVDAIGVAAQAAAGRLGRAREAADLARDYAPEPMRRSLSAAGIPLPERPVFLPAGWSGDPARPPYPPWTHPGP